MESDDAILRCGYKMGAVWKERHGAAGTQVWSRGALRVPAGRPVECHLRPLIPRVPLSEQLHVRRALIIRELSESSRATIGAQVPPTRGKPPSVISLKPLTLQLLVNLNQRHGRHLVSPGGANDADDNVEVSVERMRRGD